MKKIIYLIPMLWLLTSCFEDKGNYTYHEINSLSVTGIDSVIICDQLSPLSIPIRLEGSLYSDTTRFDYEWEVDKKIVSRSKDLNIQANFTIGEHICRFIVTDKELGTKLHQNFRLVVSSVTAGDGILVLSKYKGHAELSFKRLDKENYLFSPNYYYDVTGHQLGTEPGKIQRNYMPEKENMNSGLKILADGNIKALSEETIVEIGENSILDQYFFIGRTDTYPPQIASFHAGWMWHLMQTNSEFFPGFASKACRLYVIANGRLFHDYHTDVMGTALKISRVDIHSPSGGSFSPSMFPGYLKLKGAQDYDVSPLSYLFDETHGQFFYTDNSGTNVKAASDQVIFEGYRMMYSSHTYSANYAFVVLSNGQHSRALYLKVPGSMAEVSTIPFTVLGNTEVSPGILNENSSFYLMKNEAFILFTGGNKLYRYNLRNLEDGTAPGAGDVIAQLTDFGYNADAQITCMTVSRTEKEILLGVSRYGSDREAGSDELKGDVLVLDSKTRQLIKKYERVCGRPVDIMIKYQQYFRDGKANEVLHY